MNARLIVAVLLSGALILLGAACGGGNSEDEADVVIDITAENMKFAPDRIEVPAGKTVMLRMQNVDANQHDFEVSGLTADMTSGGGHGGMEMSGGTIAMHTEAKGKASVTFKTDKPGTYDFYCTIAGHKESGMVGKLVVTSAALSNPASRDSSAPVLSTTSTPIPSLPAITLGDGGHEGH